jgi:hypothetical protein
LSIVSRLIVIVYGVESGIPISFRSEDMTPQRSGQQGHRAG